MFPLSDALRRLLCISLFVLAGVVPTMLVGGWCYLRNRPSRRVETAEWLASQLGLKVVLDEVEAVRPGVVRLHNFGLIDPETSSHLIRCASVTVKSTTAADWQQQSVPALVIELERPDVQAEGLHELRRMAERLMQARLGTRDPHVRLVATELALHGSLETHALGEVQAVVQTVSNGVQADVGFRLLGEKSAEPVRLALVRNRQTVPPSTAFTFHTADALIPASLVTTLLPEFPAIGTQSRFNGTLWAADGSEGWQVEVRGRIVGFDLNDLARDGFPHVASGRGQLTLDRVRFRQNRLEELAGTLHAGPGMVGRSLVTAAIQRLGLAQQEDRNPNKELIPYELLAVAFLVNSKGIQFQGRCLESRTDAVLVDRQGPLLVQVSSQAQPLTALVETLTAQNQPGIPAAKLSERLWRVLPR
jgi:hypothetical protein